MNKQEATKLIKATFTQSFDKGRFLSFAKNLLNEFNEEKAANWNSQYIKDAFKNHVARYERLGTYTSPKQERIDILIVHLTDDAKLERARTAIRNFVAHHLKSRDEKEAALVAFISPTEKHWRFSFVKMDYATVRRESGKVAIEEHLTPARRFSYLVGEDESCHTAQARFVNLLQETVHPTLEDIEDAFSVEAVTKEFFDKYRELFERTQQALEKIIAKDKTIRDEFSRCHITSIDFAKKLLGQIVFLCFLQKKGWLGAAKDANWGEGPRNFLRRLVDQSFVKYKNFFNDVLETLFYNTLATDRGEDAWCKHFKCRIPFLNGGLFEPLGDYDWKKTDIVLPNSLFTNNEPVEETVTGTGILDVFDRYNFTVNEAEPLEKEVAIDPEMLGKVFENLIEDNRRKGLGAFYTPREIVHYMCQTSLVRYLETAVNKDGVVISRNDLETFVHMGDHAALYEAARLSGTKSYKPRLPDTIENNAKLIDEKLAAVLICDPAVGSGAFPVGMMTEIVRARCSVNPYFSDTTHRTPYYFKRHAIQHCLYGVDIDASAVEIAKLRLWLSLVVDEEDPKQIKPLPNLDYKIVIGNSLLGITKDLFNSETFKTLEQLKPRFFNETDRNEKKRLKGQIDQLIHHLTNGKEQFDFEIAFSEVFHRNGGFDIVVANPPYIGQKHNNALFQEVKNSVLGQYHQRRMDYFYFFFHAALNIATKTGAIAFITTNYFLTATYADKLRKDLKTRAALRVLINFNEMKIFESALGQHNMITLLTKLQTPDAPVECRFVNASCFASSDLLRDVLYHTPDIVVLSSVPNRDIYEGPSLYIRMKCTSSRFHGGDGVFDKLSRESDPLGHICELVEGIHTGADKVSESHLEKFNVRLDKGTGIYVLSAEELERLAVTSEEKDMIKPWFKNSDIQRWITPTRSDRFLVYYTSKEQYRHVENIRRHLSQFKHILVNRKTRSGTGLISTKDYDDFVAGKKYISYVMNASAFKRGDYYCVSYPREQRVFEGPKIVVPQRSPRNTFAYNDVPWYASADVYFILKRNPSCDLKYLLGLLNSQLFFYWLYNKGKRKGETLELYIRPLSEIPVKRVPRKTQQTIIEMVDRILSAKQLGPAADVGVLEQKLNELVYGVYGLTAEEIATVEGTST